MDTEWDFKDCKTRKEEKMHVVFMHVWIWKFDYSVLLNSKFFNDHGIEA